MYQLPYRHSTLRSLRQASQSMRHAQGRQLRRAECAICAQLITEYFYVSKKLGNCPWVAFPVSPFQLQTIVQSTDESINVQFINGGKASEFSVVLPKS